MRFVKMHGAGNDFVVVDGREDAADWSALARRVCDRHFGIGADGLVVVLPSQEAPIRMGEFNPDGSEPEMCGNGLRCLVKYVLERDIVPPTDALEVQTVRGVLRTEPSWDQGRVASVRVSMGPPELRWKDVPVNTYEASTRDDRLLDQVLAERLGLSAHFMFFDGRLMQNGQGTDHVVTAVSMGNPHAVEFLEIPVEQYALGERGPDVEWNLAFPRRVNYSIVNVVDRGRLRSRTWERGAGETLACGTGACAQVVAARLHGYVDEEVVVELPGGELTVRWNGEGPVSMEGPAAEVFAGEWPG